MEAQIRIGAQREFALRQALLIYGGDSAAFATLHEVVAEKGKAPYLGPGEPLTTAFLRTLASGLGASMAPEVLPENVLARTPDLMVWWSRAQRHVMFFDGGSQEAKRLNGRMYPHPALVFKVYGHELFVRALASDARPCVNTALKTAPYWNTEGSRGLVCLGSMRIPQETTVETLPQWQASYFSSAFTHVSGAVRLTSHPEGFVGLWSGLVDSLSPFPVQFLTEAKQTLRQFVESNEEQ
jgi:PRTRC genetic system protein B